MLATNPVQSRVTQLRDWPPVYWMPQLSHWTVGKTFRISPTIVACNLLCNLNFQQHCRLVLPFMDNLHTVIFQCWISLTSGTHLHYLSKKVLRLNGETITELGKVASSNSSWCRSSCLWTRMTTKRILHERKVEKDSKNNTKTKHNPAWKPTKLTSINQQLIVKNTVTVVNLFRGIWICFNFSLSLYRSSKWYYT